MFVARDGIKALAGREWWTTTTTRRAFEIQQRVPGTDRQPPSASQQLLLPLAPPTCYCRRFHCPVRCMRHGGPLLGACSPRRDQVYESRMSRVLLVCSDGVVALRGVEEAD